MVPERFSGPHTKNRPVLLQNVAPIPLGTHEHSGVHFFLSWDGNLVVLGLGTQITIVYYRQYCQYKSY